MSNHQPVLPDKCPNCGTPRTGKFCANCGQKMELHHDNFWRMLVHFVGDYFHYDNKFWRTLRYLLFRPGRLTRMYLDGKRASVIPPIQLYILVSAIFFLIFLNAIHVFIATSGTSSMVKFYVGKETPNPNVPLTTSFNYDSLQQLHQKTVSTYHKKDSIIRATPFSIRGKYLGTLIERNVARFSLDQGLYIGDQAIIELMNIFVRSIPKMFFILLPWFAFLLKLFFSQKGKYLYVDHAVFALHFHSFTFISVMIGVLLKFLPVGEWLSSIFAGVIPFIYFFLALNNFYQRKWTYTLGVGLSVAALYITSLTLVAFSNIMLILLLV